MEQVKDIGTLSKELYRARQVEKDAKSARVKVEDMIATLIVTDENGSKTVDAGDGLKITVKRALAYKADMGLIAGIAGASAVIKSTTKTELNTRAYDELRFLNPSVFAEVSKFVETKPRKVAVTLKVA